MTSREAVKLLNLVQEAQVELDRFNIATARQCMFDVNWLLRDAIKRIEQLENADTPRDY